MRWRERKPDIVEFLKATENLDNQLELSNDFENIPNKKNLELTNEERRLVKGKKRRRQKKKSEKQRKIEAAHRVSGYNEIRAHFVPGGAVRPK